MSLWWNKYDRLIIKVDENVACPQLQVYFKLNEFENKPKLASPYK